MKANFEIKAKVEENSQDGNTKVWMDTLNSESTQMNYPKHLAEYLVFIKNDIGTWIKNFKEDEVTETNRIQEFVSFQKNKPKPLAGSTIANYVSAIKSRLVRDGITISIPIKIHHRHLHHTVAEERIPTKEEMLSIIQNARPDTKLIAVLMGFLGVRFLAIAQLKVGDLPEMKISNNEITFEKFPTLIKIRSIQNKNTLAYETFFIQYGCDILKTCLEMRLRKGEKLNSDSFVIPIESKSESIRMRSSAIGRRLITAFEKINYEQRPYSLKNYFATALTNSGLEQNYQTHFMGYKGPMQNTYSLGRKHPPEQIEYMRNLFKNKIEPLLVPKDNPSEIVVKNAFKKFGSELGLEVKENETMEDTIDSIAEQLKDGNILYQAKDLGKYNKKLENKKNNPIPQTQKIIPESELAQHMEDGWTYRDALPSGSLIVEQVK